MSAPKVWLITGTSSGLGHEIALQALQRGDTVIATARDPTKLTTLTSLGAHALKLDISSSPAEVKAVIDSAYAIHGRVDIFLNCIGFLIEGALEEYSQEEFLNNFQVNVTSTFTLAQALLPHLRKQGSGTFAALGSIAGWYSGAGWTGYSMVKFALAGMMLGLKEEVKSFGIDVVLIEPGYFRTGFLNGRVVAKKEMEEYKPVLKPVKDFFNTRSGQQRGDPVKGAKVVVEVLTRSGKAEGKELPERLLLGADAVEVGLGTMEKEKKVIEEWRVIVEGTDHEVQFE
ncbi:3-oxoacyl-reductase [Ascobolus immersus RN42]|uniref:3-oxoacyl-reductase n=1 Tax=Ascobolus immersus RN42 TaxID=1160509 RepID=A0A3N4INI9_ASCIM|nr:3-oxoacyl-reductase [Ascobolus immersus RN42]